MERPELRGRSCQARMLSKISLAKVPSNHRQLLAMEWPECGDLQACSPVDVCATRWHLSPAMKSLILAFVAALAASSALAAKTDIRRDCSSIRPSFRDQTILPILRRRRPTQAVRPREAVAGRLLRQHRLPDLPQSRGGQARACPMRPGEGDPPPLISERDFAGPQELCADSEPPH